MKISAIVITKNEEKNIKDCLFCLDWVDEIVVIDSKSSDKTREIAKRMGARVFVCNAQGFDERRNMALKKADGEWLLYVDADERVSEKLKIEILEKINNPGSYSAFEIPRLNIFFGHPMKYGGWYPDFQTRLFKKNDLSHWFGKIHASPNFNGKTGKLKNHFIHLSHCSIKESFEKSTVWTQMEANLFIKANHPPIKVYH